MDASRGFPDEAFDFYEGLQADNSKAYWTAHRETYETAVRAPLVALLAALEDEFGAGHVFRPYRDVRFSKDKTPYKDHQGAFAEVGDAVGYYVQISADGLLCRRRLVRPAGRSRSRATGTWSTARPVPSSNGSSPRHAGRARPRRRPC